MKVVKKLKQKVDTLHDESTCQLCGKTKLKIDFSRQKGLFIHCKECKSHLNRINRFGIAPGYYDDLLKLQEGKCAICESELKQEKNLSVIDHCHKTGEIRGILCIKCNTAIGFFGDKPSLFKQAMRYINEPVARGLKQEPFTTKFEAIRNYYKQKAQTSSSDMV